MMLPAPIIMCFLAMLNLKSVLRMHAVSRKLNALVRDLTSTWSVLDISGLKFERIESARFDTLCNYISPLVKSVVAVACMTRTDFCDAQFSKLCGNLPVGLVTLVLSRNLLDDDGIRSLSAALPTLHVLQRLELSKCLAHAKLASKRMLFMAMPASIRFLVLDGNGGSSTMMKLADGLRRLVHLTKLSLRWWTNFDEEADGGTGHSPAFHSRELDAIFDALPSGLDSLALAGSVELSYYGEEVAESLIRHLPRFPGLLWLGLEDCYMDDVSLGQFMRLLGALPRSLKGLALVPPAGEASLQAVLEEVVSLPALERLHLWDESDDLELDSTDLEETRAELCVQ